MLHRSTLPRLGSQSGTVEANPDGSTDLYFGPTGPEGNASNWLQTIPGKGWWLYNPLQPFFDASWRPSEIEPQEPGSNGHSAPIGC